MSGLELLREDLDLIDQIRDGMFVESMSLLAETAFERLTGHKLDPAHVRSFRASLTAQVAEWHRDRQIKESGRP